MATDISLCEAGAEFDVSIINLKDNEQSSVDYAALNTKKKVSYLVVDGKGLQFSSGISSHEDIKEKAKAMYREQLALIDSEPEDRRRFFDHFTVERVKPCRLRRGGCRERAFVRRWD